MRDLAFSNILFMRADVSVKHRKRNWRKIVVFFLFEKSSKFLECPQQIFLCLVLAFSIITLPYINLNVTSRKDETDIVSRQKFVKFSFDIVINYCLSALCFWFRCIDVRPYRQQSYFSRRSFNIFLKQGFYNCLFGLCLWASFFLLEWYFVLLKKTVYL